MAVPPPLLLLLLLLRLLFFFLFFLFSLSAGPFLMKFQGDVRQ